MYYSNWSVDSNDTDFTISRKWVKKHSLQFEMETCTQIGLIYVSCKDSLDMMLNHQEHGHVDRFIDQDFQKQIFDVTESEFLREKEESDDSEIHRVILKINSAANVR